MLSIRFSTYCEISSLPEPLEIEGLLRVIIEELEYCCWCYSHYPCYSSTNKSLHPASCMNSGRYFHLWPKIQECICCIGFLNWFWNVFCFQYVLLTYFDFYLVHSFLQKILKSFRLWFNPDYFSCDLSPAISTYWECNRNYKYSTVWNEAIIYKCYIVIKFLKFRCLTYEKGLWQFFNTWVYQWDSCAILNRGEILKINVGMDKTY